MTVTPTPPPPPDELEALLRRLRLPYVRRAAPDVVANATAQRWEHAEVLRVLLAEEAAGRDQATIRTRHRSSGLPAGKTFDAWEPDRSVIPAQTPGARPRMGTRTIPSADGKITSQRVLTAGRPAELWTASTGR